MRYADYYSGYEDGFCDVCDYYYCREIPSIKKISLSGTTYTYDGNVHKPTASITLENGKKLSSNNYSVSYSSGCKNVGTYKAIVNGRNDYTGSQTLKFKINPKGTSIKSLTRAKKAFTVKWGKQSTQTTGYQIRYSKKSSMASAKTVTVKSNKTLSKKIKSLKAKTTYYVQVRTYKTVNNTKYYSAWSTE